MFGHAEEPGDSLSQAAMSAEVSRRGSATKWLLVCFLFLLQLVSAAPNIVETDGALREHLVRNGAELGFVMGTPADGGMRGAFASKDYSVGDIVARIPRNMTVELGFGDIKKSSKRLVRVAASLIEPPLPRYWTTCACPGPELSGARGKQRTVSDPTRCFNPRRLRSRQRCSTPITGPAGRPCRSRRYFTAVGS